MGGVKGEDVVVARQLTLDPLAAISLHKERSGGLAEELLASYTTAKGRRAYLTQRKFVDRINVILVAEGVPRISGHCLRIGGTTHLLLSGIPPDIVKMLGRWSSDAFLRYWRSLEIIAPMYIEMLKPLVQYSRILSGSAS